MGSVGTKSRFEDTDVFDIEGEEEGVAEREDFPDDEVPYDETGEDEDVGDEEELE